MTNNLRYVRTVKPNAVKQTQVLHLWLWDWIEENDLLFSPFFCNVM